MKRRFVRIRRPGARLESPLDSGRAISRSASGVNSTLREMGRPDRGHFLSGPLGGTIIALSLMLASPAALSAESVHVVQPGETLSGIADRFDTDLATLLRLNHITDPTRLQIGEQIVVQPDQPATYVVAPGDTLSSIAGRVHLSVDQLAALNDLRDPDRLAVGTPLLVEARALTYEVKRGDTLSQIALNYGTTPAQLESWNHIADPRQLAIGTQLLVAPQPTVHVVKPGDSLWSIAQDAGVTVASLRSANHLLDPNVLTIGMNLAIPPVGGGEYALGGGAGFANPRTVPGGFAWPVHGAITSPFGWRFNHTERHEGIDIAASLGAKVRAAADGVVSYATWAGTYGMLVTIQHPLGYQTRYAHLSKILVTRGQVVKAGDVVGLVGATGHATGPHLHFETRRDGQAIDPLRFLPKT